MKVISKNEDPKLVKVRGIKILKLLRRNFKVSNGEFSTEMVIDYCLK